MPGQDLFITEYSGEILQWADRIPMQQPAWVFVILFALLAGLAWIRLAYGSLIQNLLESGFSYQVAARIFKDSSLFQKQLGNILSGYYVLSVSLLLYYIEVSFKLSPYGLSGLGLMAFNLGFLMLLALFRLVITWLFGALFDMDVLYREYYYNTQIYNKILGVIVPLLLLVSLYTKGGLSQVFHYLLLAFLVLVLIMRIIRGLVFSFKKDVSKFYMFLYLCALEMAPLVLLYRWLEGIL